MCPHENTLRFCAGLVFLWVLGLWWDSDKISSWHFCNAGKSKPDTVRAATCCMVLVRLLGSKPCFDAIRTLPEIATILFQVLSFSFFLNTCSDHVLSAPRICRLEFSYRTETIAPSLYCSAFIPKIESLHITQHWSYVQLSNLLLNPDQLKLLLHRR